MSSINGRGWNCHGEFVRDPALVAAVVKALARRFKRALDGVGALRYSEQSVTVWGRDFKGCLDLTDPARPRTEITEL